MKTMTKRVTIALLLAAMVFPAASFAQTPPQDDRLERREFQVRTADDEFVATPQNDRLKRRELQNRLQEVQDIKEMKKEYEEARRLRIEAGERADEAEQKERVERHMEAQQALLRKMVETLMSHMDALEARANAITDADLKNRALTTIQEQSATLQALLNRITAAEDRETLSAIAGELRELRNTMKQGVKNVAKDTNATKLVIIGHIDRFESTYLRKAQERANKIEAALDRFAENGVNVDAARALLDAANERIAFSSAELQSIRDRIESLESLEGTDLASLRVSLSTIKNGMKTLYDTYLEIAQHVQAF